MRGLSSHRAHRFGWAAWVRWGLGGKRISVSQIVNVTNVQRSRVSSHTTVCNRICGQSSPADRRHGRGGDAAATAAAAQHQRIVGVAAAAYVSNDAAPCLMNRAVDWANFADVGRPFASAAAAGRDEKRRRGGWAQPSLNDHTAGNTAAAAKSWRKRCAPVGGLAQTRRCRRRSG